MKTAMRFGWVVGLAWASTPLEAAELPPRRVDDPAAKSAGALDAKAIDDRVYEMLRYVLQDGARMYNSGDHTACANYFLGALTMTEPMLEHRPNLQRAITKGMLEQRRYRRGDERAWTLYQVITSVRASLEPAAIVVGEGKTLWERLGGARNVEAIVDEFIDAAVADPKVNFSRNGKFRMTSGQVSELKRTLVVLTSAVAGGPGKYAGRRMKEVHRGMGITHDEFDALRTHLKIAMLRHGIKPKDFETVMEVVALTRADIVEAKDAAAPTLPPPGSTSSLWGRLGGEAGVTAIADDFVDAAIADPQVNFFRNGRFPMTRAQIADFKRKLVALASAIGGGPLKYEGKGMKEVHERMAITDAEFDALLGHLKIALVRHNVSALDVTLILRAADGTRKDIVQEGSGPAPRRPAKMPGSVQLPSQPRPPVRVATSSEFGMGDVAILLLRECSLLGGWTGAFLSSLGEVLAADSKKLDAASRPK